MNKKLKPKEPSRFEQIEWVNCEGCKFAGLVENAHHICDITKIITPFMQDKPCIHKQKQ